MTPHEEPIHLLVNGTLEIASVEKLLTGQKNQFDEELFRLRLCISSMSYENSRDFESMEPAIIDLQNLLPEPVLIACCQSCRYGNFCPCGDNEDEIFCLHGYTVADKMEVLNVFDLRPRDVQPHRLLDRCDHYDRITEDDGFYTYNDWDHYVKR